MFTLFSQLANLQTLYCCHNQLTELDESIGQLTNLKKLYCHNNQLTELPPTIINLRNIDEFRINHSVKLSDQQKRYFEWIKSNKETIFDEYCDTTLIKYAGFIK